MGLMGTAHFGVMVTMPMVALVSVCAASLLACRKRLANMNSYSVFIPASVTALPKVSDICFLWLAGVILGLRGQLFIHEPSAEEWMLLVLAAGSREGRCSSSRTSS